MGRTNIELDDDLVAEVMRRHGVRTKREAVDLALRRLVGPVMSRGDMLALEGTGWDGDLTSLRSDAVEPLTTSSTESASGSDPGERPA
ncbi:type II toxin-antitoxin system VapB family antitoxin [Serinibacter salmoneus]|uniref:Arc/MetJ family transcription regulator n=1 Tax=Serinibacter salmoneus TaxID=556530 RepID=A0A2A9D5T3_9MICO|nr:type II toxin-antitoxin system VapB family antitoxin [Serinibacter salmoneus]PFG21200.1 Arc/MetJ family transcription regulator [Serinibacter salmoneus]